MEADDILLVPENYHDRSVCVIGLGFVGLTLAVAMAEVGFQVTGVEIQEDVVKKLTSGDAHFYEPNLDETLSRVIDDGSLLICNKIPPKSGSTVYIITVGTPLSREGYARYDMVERVAADVAKRLRENDLVILRSTVKVGSTQKIVLPILKKAGVEFNLAFCPERTLEGKALEEIHNLPQIVSGIDMPSNIRAAQLFQFLTPTVVQVGNLETAEMIKLVDNTLRDVQFAFANEVAHMCDAIGVNAFVVIKAGKLGYPRTNLAVPGPVGGPCLEKDPHILAETMRELGVEPYISMAARGVNERLPAECIRYVANVVNLENIDVRKVIILGLAFKGQPVTDDMRGTMARSIFKALECKFPKAKFYGFDDAVSSDDIKEFGLQPVEELEKAFKLADIVLIANNHPIFSSMAIGKLSASMQKPSLIYDFWNNFAGRKLSLASGVRYVSLGAHGLSKV